ncbi:phosphoenolpyruvate carboxykinase (ATP) [Mycoplasmatota bacterium]|nr:phosphoenolpyruvate carboxykinase (ATP) [Mycoplasmatota bacterium]
MKDALNLIKKLAHFQLSQDELIEIIKNKKEALVNKDNVVIVDNGEYTGRSPKDRFIVKSKSAPNVAWNDINQPISKDIFDNILSKAIKYMEDKELYLFKGFAGADVKHRLFIDVLTEKAWHNLFAKQIFIRPNERELKVHNPEFTVICLPDFKVDPVVDKVNSDVFIGVNFEDKIVLICGTSYGGEIKKSIFGVLNYLLPEAGVFPMHCSANTDSSDRTALFFGLSGTGKTTLSMDPVKLLVGDDEHGWTDKGIYNFEGGSYAKVDGLTYEKDPVIFDLINEGTIVENAVVQEILDFEDTSVSQNIRAVIQVDKIDTRKEDLMAGHPKAIIFLSADAYGVIPPISKLTNEQAMYYFMSGYTSKIPGTERGVAEPITVFSECFGAPFMPRAAIEYATMLRNKIEEYDIPVYLINTGWYGGKYGTGKRIKLKYTRRMVDAAINGELSDIEFTSDNEFNLAVPIYIEGVPTDLLTPEKMWVNNVEYKDTVNGLIKQFKSNFSKFEDLDGINDVITKGQPR